MKIDVLEALYPFYNTKVTTHDTATVTKMRFVGSNSQMYYDNLHRGAQSFRYCRPDYVYFYELGLYGRQRFQDIFRFLHCFCSASTRLFDCRFTKHAHTVDQGSQTRRPHVAHEGIFCGSRCVQGIFT